MDQNAIKDLSLSPTSLDSSALAIGSAYNDSQETVMKAFAMTEDASPDQLQALAKELGVTDTKNLTVRGLQTVAQQRYERSGQVLMLFSTLLDKMNQLKERIINNISR